MYLFIKRSLGIIIRVTMPFDVCTYLFNNIFFFCKLELETFDQDRRFPVNLTRIDIVLSLVNVNHRNTTRFSSIVIILLYSMFSKQFFQQHVHILRVC